MQVGNGWDVEWGSGLAGSGQLRTAPDGGTLQQ